MTKLVSISIIITLVVSCKFEKKSESRYDNKNTDSSSISNKKTIEEEISTIEHESNAVETINCEINNYFSTIKLPLKIDYDFFRSFEHRSNKTRIPYECVGDGTMNYYEGLPSFVNYAYGRIQLKDSSEYYLVIKGMNPEIPFDLFYISASIFTLNQNKLDNEILTAKYHYYSKITEEYYCSIDLNGRIEQHYKHTGELEGDKEVFKQGDTTIILTNNLKKNLR